MHLYHQEKLLCVYYTLETKVTLILETQIPQTGLALNLVHARE